MVSRMRPMVCERKTRSASGTAESRDAPRSMAPLARESAMAAGELTPVIAPSKPAWRRASPKDEPIRPVPTMTTFCMLNGPAHGKRDCLQLTHQLLELLGPQRLRPVGERAVGIGMDFDHQAVGARGYGGPRPPGPPGAAAPRV